jgi:hypothetical protein
MHALIAADSSGNPEVDLKYLEREQGELERLQREGISEGPSGKLTLNGDYKQQFYDFLQKIYPLLEWRTRDWIACLKKSDGTIDPVKVDQYLAKIGEINGVVFAHEKEAPLEMDGRLFCVNWHQKNMRPKPIPDGFITFNSEGIIFRGFSPEEQFIRRRPLLSKPEYLASIEAWIKRLEESICSGPPAPESQMSLEKIMKAQKISCN